MRSSNIGGQAVLEGIMMRNGGKYSVAVRKPDGEIESEVWDYHSVIPWKVLLKIPFIRGIFNFVDSLVLGMKTLMYSASFFEEEEEGELVLVQGIIDVYFEEEDGLVVLDYKTDRVRTADELVRRYQSQLTYYARALSQITGKAVKEKIIYSFALGKEINV